jgi:hypothetical protein
MKEKQTGPTLLYVSLHTQLLRSSLKERKRKLLTPLENLSTWIHKEGKICRYALKS